MLGSYEKALYTYHFARGEVRELARFDMQRLEYHGGDLRCDLHPRWHREGHTLCVDAIAADGTRQLHLVRLDRS